MLEKLEAPSFTTMTVEHYHQHTGGRNFGEKSTGDAKDGD